MDWQLTVTLLGIMGTIITAIIKLSPQKTDNRHIDDLRKELHSAVGDVKEDIKTLSHRIDKFILEIKR